MKTVIVHIKDAVTRGVLMLLVVMVSFSAFADDGPIVLWWQVGPDGEEVTLEDITINTFHQGQQTAESMDVHYARVKVVETGAYLPVVTLDTEGNVVSSFPINPIPGYAYSSVITPYADAAYSFMIELGNWDSNADPQWTMVAMSEAVSYNTLLEDGHIGVWSGNTIYAQNPGTWTVSTYTVPEPSSGLLLIVGGALLALRRRRRRVGE